MTVAHLNRTATGLSITVDPKLQDQSNSIRKDKSVDNENAVHKTPGVEALRLTNKRHILSVFTDHGEGIEFPITCNLCKTEMAQNTVEKHSLSNYHKVLEAEMMTVVRLRAMGESREKIEAAAHRTSHMFVGDVGSVQQDEGTHQ